jgi:Protein of unknown function (DUF1194)
MADRRCLWTLPRELPVLFRAVAPLLQVQEVDLVLVFLADASGSITQTAVAWLVIDGAESSRDYALALLEPPRLATGRNAIGDVLPEGQRLLDWNRIAGPHRLCCTNRLKARFSLSPHWSAP